MTQQELIDALANGGTIQLGDETIVIDTNLVISQDGTRLLGNGWDNSVIDFKPGIGMHISANDIIVEDIHFTNTFLADGAEQHSLEVNGGYENIHINKVKVSNGDDAGIRIGYRWSGSQNTRVAASHCQITNCELKNINEGSGIEVMSASHVLIANNKISGCTQSGIRIAGGSHCKIHNNEIDNINESGARYHGGIYAVGGGSRKFWDYIRHIDIKGNKITTDSKGIIIGTQTEHVSIDCNEIILTNEVDSTGIYLTSSHNDAEFGYRNISISSNLIKGVLANGIELHTRDNQPFVSGQNVSILKNIIKGFHGTGINVRGNNIGEVLDIYIRDNAFQKVDIPNTQFVTITECDDIYIGDNLKSTSIDEDEIFLRNNAVIELKDKRILIAGFFHFPSGTAPASRILNIAEGFLLNNFKVDVVAFCPPPGQSAKPDFWYSLKENIRFRYIAESQAANNSISEKISWYRNNWKAGKQIKNILEQEIKDSAYDAILIYGRNYSILGPVTKLANALDIPLITDLVELPRTSISKKYYLNPIHIDQHIGLKYTINRSQVVTVITRYLGDFIDNKNTYLMPSVQVWKDEAIEREYKIGNEIKIIYVGNLIKRDNPKVMFDFIKAVNQHINVKLQLLGRFKNKADWKYWEEYVSKDEVLSESVQVIGEVTEKEKEEYYNNAEAFILPRRNHFDEVASFPTRIVEFLKERKLVIASPIGDIPHYLSENEIIYLEEDNMDQSVQLAIDTFSSVTSYQSYIERAYKVASQKFNTETHVSKILEIIR